MKNFKLLILLCLIGICGASQPLFAGYCVVSMEDDNVETGNDYTFREKIEDIYNYDSTANCNPPSESDPFDQVILFATAEAGYANNVNTITLEKTLTFSNRVFDLMIGNWAPEVVQDTASHAYSLYDDAEDDYDYITKVIAAGDYGRIFLDARDGGLSCAKGTKAVYFRHIYLAVDGPLDSCFQDGGDVEVCMGDVMHNPISNPVGWCDGDQDGYASDEDCDDNDPTVHDNCDEEPGCSLTVSPSTATLEAGESQGFSVTLTNTGGYEEDAVVEVSGLTSGMSLSDGVTVSDGVAKTMTLTTSSSMSSGTTILTFKAESAGKDGETVTCSDTVQVSVTGDDCEAETEIPYDGIDQDCDGDDLTDVDGDGYDSTEVSGGTDCEDDDATVHPRATDICEDGEDTDCDGADEVCVDPNDCVETVWYKDADVDGYGDPLASKAACAQPSGYVSNDKDCDDADIAVNPAAAESTDELCADGVDNDCDGIVDGGINCAETAVPDFGSKLQGGNGCGLRQNDRVDFTPFLMSLLFLGMIVAARYKFSSANRR